jgi:catechol 2,3-dioxygenase-like lactoylglutathione lyase family enzyme
MSVAGFDHVSLPMRDTDAMIAFYRALSFDVDEQNAVVAVRAGVNMINFHRPELWPRPDFTLRAPEAVPPCGDLCFVWEGDADSLQARLEGVDAPIEEGPVARVGARRAAATSVYVRDPDGNLLEFMIYRGDSEATGGERSVEPTHGYGDTE